VQTTGGWRGRDAIRPSQWGRECGRMKALFTP